MTLRSRRILLVVAGLGVILIAAVWVVNRLTVLEAPLPVMHSGTIDTLPGMPYSIVEAPVTYDLQTAIDSLEAAVPIDYGDLEHRIVTTRNKQLSYAFLLHRSPFRVAVHATTVTISADVEYSGRAWYQPPIGPEVEVACGTDDQLPRRATLIVETTAELTRDWGLRTHSRVVRLAAYSDSARDRCRLTFLRLDVTPRVLESTTRVLEEKLALFDDAVARWPVRPRFEKVWRSMQKPVRLADSVYLAFHPSRALLGSVGVRGATAFANLTLIATPRVTTGPRPHFARVPLPPLEVADDSGHGARVLLDASFTYPVATDMLRKAIVGMHVEQAGHRVRIRDVRIFGIGAGKVALCIWLSGAVHGRVFFTGTPAFDSVSRQIVVPDLDYDVGTADVLVKGYEWLNDVKLRDFLRDRARLPDSAVVRRLADLAEDGLNRDLPARGTHLSGHISQAGVIAVVATQADIRVRALADAKLKLAIDRAPSIPRPPEVHGAGEDEENEER